MMESSSEASANLTPQMQADHDLSLWQANRHLTPEQRLEILFFDVLLSLPISVTAAEYERQMEAVSASMLEAA